MVGRTNALISMTSDMQYVSVASNGTGNVNNTVTVTKDGYAYFFVPAHCPSGNGWKTNVIYSYNGVQTTISSNAAWASSKFEVKKGGTIYIDCECYDTSDLTSVYVVFP